MQDIQYDSLASVPLSDMVKQEYRNYQIYTLMDRAIPYLQDGLKPSQRRILYTLWKNQNKGLIKVSSLTGLVLTLHPHGPNSIETSIVNLAQDFTFSNNYPLLEKKGYFGERMETSAAAARYIECKLGEVAKLLLFDDMNQLEMVPNYDEKVMEPVCFYPKLPLMLLNGAEGIGTGFSSFIPSYNHSHMIASIKSIVTEDKPKKIKPWVRFYNEKIDSDERGRFLFPMGIEQKGESFFITELPRGYDAQKIYKHLNKLVENDFIKDYIDNTVDNDVNIELIFKRGQNPTLEEVISKVKTTSSIVPNFTLISEGGVVIFEKVEEILVHFAHTRLKVVKRRFELLIHDAQERLSKNNEIIRFIKEKHYAIAEKKANRKDYVGYLDKEKFVFSEYLADMPIYRMTKEEVQKRQNLIEEDKENIKKYQKIVSSPALIKKELINELDDVDTKLTQIMKHYDDQKKEAAKKGLKDRPIKSTKMRQ